MNIAFISYEYPPDTAFGGIATYVEQAARMLAGRGHRVEVFAASPAAAGTREQDGVRVHRVVERQPAFGERIGPVFAARHAAAPFDVLEGPEYGADARDAVRRVPSMPLVVKLHTPTYMIERMNDSSSRLGKLRGRFGSWRRGIPPPGHPLRGPEAAHALGDADEWVAPSRALGDICTRDWSLDPARVRVVPYPYEPRPALLHIPAATQTNTVLFLGRLEQRKGVLDLAAAIPMVLEQFPQAKFRFVGRPELSPVRRLDMKQYLERELRAHADAVEFCAPVALDAVPDVLAAADVCVFPSLWENFPNVCLESMAAARGVVASEAGGMAEMLDGGRHGLLVPSGEPERIAEAIVRLLQNPAERMQFGTSARARVLTEYAPERIARLQEESYARAIARRLAMGPRPVRDNKT